MRIASYNVWNSTVDWSRRLASLVDEWAVLDTDIVAMQEAPTRATDTQSLVDFFRAQTDYPHALHREYPAEPADGERPEGLAFLSKLPFEDHQVNWENGRDTANNWALRVIVDWQGRSLGVTNIHLDWEHSANRRQHIVSIVRDLIGELPCDHDVLCGDFNADADSRVARYLLGECPIDDHTTLWRDLAHEGHASRGGVAPITLDTLGNPHLTGRQTGPSPGRYDRIYLQEGEADIESRTLDSGLFGNVPTDSSGIVPSDHYGVFVDLERPRQP